MSISLLGRSLVSPSPPLRCNTSRRRARFCCRLDDSGNRPEGEKDREERPESLFMKELRRRGMSTGGEHGGSAAAESKEEEKERGGGEWRRRGVASLGFEEVDAEKQRERSMALNSEGLEGLIPRAKLLLTLGGTFFLSFGPLILVTVASFSALYLYFGQSFVHDANDTHISPPQYIDPYELLKEEPVYSLVAPPLE